jgi:O-acetyl-ADP-ribose deacetylase (regulator of RNase III)
VPAIKRVVQGDISTFEGDVVVNAANNHLRMGTGVAGALLKRGGGTIQDECDEYVRRNGPLKVGEAAITGAGNLAVRYVIHAAAMGDSPPTPETIRQATRNALVLAREHKLRHLAIPILGSGVGGFPFAEAARIVVDEVEEFTSGTPEMETVVFYGYTPDQAATLQRFLI